MAGAEGQGYEAAWRETSEALATMLGCGVDDEPVVASSLHPRDRVRVRVRDEARRDRVRLRARLRARVRAAHP